MTTTETKINDLKSAAHPLRDESPAGSGLDYLRRPTSGRITYGEACRKFGKRLVHKAMDDGDVYLEGVRNINGAAFDPANATTETRLVANGVNIA